MAHVLLNYKNIFKFIIVLDNYCGSVIPHIGGIKPLYLPIINNSKLTNDVFDIYLTFYIDVLSLDQMRINWLINYEISIFFFS